MNTTNNQQSTNGNEQNEMSKEIAQLKIDAEQEIEEILQKLKDNGYPVFRIDVYNAGQNVNLIRYQSKGGEQ